MRNSGRHHGFTLLELLLAMAMAAILSVALYSTLNTAIRARRTAQSIAQSTRTGSIAMDLICHDLESVVRPAPSDANTLTLNGTFEGVHKGGVGTETDDLLFRTIGYEATADANDPLVEGVREVEFYISTDTNPPALVRRVNRNVLAPTQQTGDVEVLCRNVRGFGVQYYDGQNWQTDWDSTQIGDVLPLAVRVTLTLSDPAGSTLPNGQPVVRTISRTIPIATGKLQPTG